MVGKQRAETERVVRNVRDIDEQDADHHAMVDEAHYKNDEVTISDGDTKGSNNLFDEDGSDDGTNLETK